MNRIILPATFLKLLWDYYSRQCSLNNIGRRGMTTYYQSMGWNLIYDCAIPGYTLLENQLVFFLLAIS